MSERTEAINQSSTRISVDGVLLEPGVPVTVTVTDSVRELAAAGVLALAAATDFEKLNLEGLQAEAARRGVQVTGTGQDGRVLKADLVAALSNTAHREE